MILETKPGSYFCEGAGKLLMCEQMVTWWSVVPRDIKDHKHRHFLSHARRRLAWSFEDMKAEEPDYLCGKKSMSQKDQVMNQDKFT